MNIITTLRKPRSYFDTVAHALHVTFDDGHSVRRNLVWGHLAEARMDRGEPTAIKLIIGDWLVVLEGNNLDSLFEAIEGQTLLRVKAQPELKNDREKDCDIYVTRIMFYPCPKSAGVGHAWTKGTPNRDSRSISRSDLAWKAPEPDRESEC